ncbi:miniconductance mechanosensitive channel MscM [Pragia fontium]|uniref:miniconductance mechanosensitive channel MscM n=1 Tax=Pragia fontium TaxID=82985 RepID=UPI00064A200A|nr:miniconductance mechanosensitive channel MscM [Pragia fontium]AKJ41010.1 mechanosensitive channel protein [Pragia fontium]
MKRTRLLLALLSLLFIIPLQAAILPDTGQIKQEIKLAEANKDVPSQKEIVEIYQSALSWLEDRTESVSRSQQYRKAIDEFPKLTKMLRTQLESSSNELPAPSDTLTIAELEQQSIQINSQLLELSRQLQQEQDRAREISNSLTQLPLQLASTRKALNELELRQPVTGTQTSSLNQAKNIQLQAELAFYKAKVDELELEQLSASNRQEISRLQIEILKNKQAKTDNLLQVTNSQLNFKRQAETKQTLEHTTQLAEQNGDLPTSIRKLLQENQELSEQLSQQAVRMDEISTEQRAAITKILQVHQAMTSLTEQAQWLGMSTALGETLRMQVSRLPEVPKPQPLDSEMAEMRVQRLSLDEQRDKLSQMKPLTQDDGQPLTTQQQELVKQQIKMQQDLLSSLLSGYDTLILELTKLKVSNNQLIDALAEIKDASHRYLFWVADVNPLTFSYPIQVVQDLNQLLSLDTLSELSSAFSMMLTTKESVGLIIAAIVLVGFNISSRRHYQAFLERVASRIGKVTQDQFYATIRTVFWSIIVAVPLPVLWWALAYGLQHAWQYPIAVAIGEGVNATVPLMWVFMISASFAHPQGLFIAHFRWSQSRVARAMRYYGLSLWIVIPLIIASISFDNFNDREFSGTLGRLCFILLCGALIMMTTNLRRAGIPLYLDRKGSGENMVNQALWTFLICAPIAAALAACFGYLATAQALLLRLEASVAIWFGLLVIYHIIRRWMLIQRRRIEFDRAKQRRAERLAQRAKGEEDNTPSNSDNLSDSDDSVVVDLDAISAQSLQLVRSILTMIALVSLIILWSEIHSAFAFLENIRLWDVTSSAQGAESIQAITLGSVLISALVFIVTTQLVRNLPALLELALLQHLDLTPGTGYAITTITKYILMLIGGMVAFSMIGVDWSKLQWLVAALGVGLGFGLQEIFANFVSGLIILFEKPIRIGDTVTIRDLTGSITKINTRATTIVDWDRKEIIVPNKAFITEQFVNWSLSDAITRIVLTVPATADTDPNLIKQLLESAAHRCQYVLDTPQPDAFLVDIQQGIQIFELRVFAADMSSRMPLRHEMHSLILQAYAEHNLTLPFPPFQMRADAMSRSGVRPPFKTGEI